MPLVGIRCQDSSHAVGLETHPTLLCVRQYMLLISAIIIVPAAMILLIDTPHCLLTRRKLYMCKLLRSVCDGSNSQQWTCISQDCTYSSYSVVALSPSHDKLAVGSLDGRIKIISIGKTWSYMVAVCLAILLETQDLLP